MMLPIALAITTQLAAEFGEQPTAGLTRALLLASAYASSIGGLATPVGTPTNLILIRQYELLFPGAPQITFGHWMLFFVPLSTLLLILSWLLLARLCGSSPRIDRSVIAAELARLGRMGTDQRVVFALFCAAALLWITRAPVALGSLTFPGWGALFTHANAAGQLVAYVDDGTVAIALAVLLFLIPSRTPGSGALMRWEDTRHLPWGTVVLFGGGFALAEAFAVSGLGDWFGARLAVIGGLPPLLLVFIVYSTVTLLSEFASNTAASQLILPIVAAVATALGLPPLTLMLAAANGASLDFVLPSATPPNAMVLATGKVSVGQLVRMGLAVELMCLVVVTLAIYFFGAHLA
jgi:sodium-dependent dicarboxylate transporter 2/3/5